MPETMQRWLSLTGICDVLQTSPRHIEWLVKNRFLEKIPAHPRKGGARYLDPTPEYAVRLRLTEMIYGRRVPLPAWFDYSEKALFTKNEIAVICGWTEMYVVKYLHQHKVPAIKCGHPKTGLCLYTAKTVRDILWRKSGKRFGPQKGPFLLSELIAWFWKHQADAGEDIPTDRQFLDDARLQKKLERILKMKSPQREQALRDMLAKVGLAKTTSGLLLTVPTIAASSTCGVPRTSGTE